MTELPSVRRRSATRPAEVRRRLRAPEAASKGGGRHGRRPVTGIALRVGSAVRHGERALPEDARWASRRTSRSTRSVSSSLGDFDKIEEARRSAGPARSLGPGGRASRPRHRPARQPDRRPRRHRHRRPPRARTPGAGVMACKSVHEPLATGIKAIDSMTPIGRGQRQLIIGDRATGKTTIAIDTIINQKQNWDVGRPEPSRSAASTSPSARRGSPSPLVRGALEEAGALEYTTIVAAPASDRRASVPRALHRLGHRPALDVRRQARPHRLRRPSKQAEAYRAVSLLLRRPPGARPTRATSSTCTAGCSSARQAVRRASAPAR